MLERSVPTLSLSNSVSPRSFLHLDQTRDFSIPGIEIMVELYCTLRHLSPVISRRGILDASRLTLMIDSICKYIKLMLVK